MSSTAATGLAGVVAIACALAVAVRRGHRGDQLPGTRWFLTVAPLVWGAGQVTSAVRGDPVPPGRAWWVLVAAALTVVAVALVPWRTPEPLERLRVAAEGAMVTGALALLAWNLLFEPGGWQAPDGPGTFALLVLNAAFVSLNLISVTRHLDLGMALGLAGAVAYVSGGVLGAAAPDRLGAAALVSAAGWVVMTAGMLFPPPVRATGRRTASADTARRMMSASLPLLLLAGLDAVLGIGGRTITSTTLTLVALFIFALWVREMIHAVQQGRLLARLEELADTDPMTGLANRRALAPALAELYAPPFRDVSVMTLDLDGFKDVNTVLGHDIGDALLVAAAAHLRERCATVRARPFRLGGDEFAVLAEEPPAGVERLAADLLATFPAVTGTVPGVNRVSVSVSIGIAHRADAAADTAAGVGGERAGLTELARSGDAMRAAKEAGKARYLVHDASLVRGLSRRALIERRLRARLAGDGIELHHQPIISLPEMRMTGAESLARWDDEELGRVPPDEFIPVAEDCGLIVELGLQVARASMRAAITTGAQAAGLNLGVNVSAVQLRSSGFVREVAALLDEIGIKPERFVIEITESARIETDDTAAAAITALAALGLVVALDDFGTGYSSLGYLTDLPVRVLKLDRSLTRRLGDARGHAVARAVSDMAREIGIDVVAEGIETRADLARVRGLGVGFGQGWLFSPAVDVERFAELVRDPALALGDARALVE